MQEAAAIRTIGKYKILGTLGRGSMGVVYRAQDPEIGRIVAIKILRAPAAGASEPDAKALERFKVEARAAGNLRHPHIITVFDVNIDGDTPYIVMDYIEGEGLDTVIQRNGRLDPRQMVHYLWQVASGLDYAHSRKVIHRDIKPSNILVDKSENVFILDFGVARFGESARSEESIVGTPSYMSPEQILHRELDAKSDLFSLGVVAFECLTGQRPFPGANFSEVVNNILNAPPLSLIDVAPQIPLSLEVEFQRALAKSSSDRFESAEEMLSEMAKALGFDLQEKNPTSAPRRRKLSDWRSIRPMMPASEPEEPRKRSNTPSSLSPWRPEHRSVDAGSFTMTAPSRIVARPGALYSSSEDTLLRPQQQNSTMRALTLFFGSVCIVLSLVLFWLLYGDGSSGESTTESLPVSVLMEDVPNSASSNLDGTLTNPSVEPPPQGKPVYEMNDRQLLGVLVSEESEDSLALEALHEANSRGLADLVDAGVNLLKRDSYVVRIETLKVLAELGDKRVVPYVVVVLDDYDPLVRRWAAKTLAKLGDRRALGYLQARIVKENIEEVKGDLRKAIERITGVPYAK